MKHCWQFLVILVAAIGFISCSETSETTTQTYESPAELDTLLDRLELPVDVETEIQEEIASCMKSKGFEYIPFVIGNLDSTEFSFTESDSPGTDSYESSLKRDGPVDPNVEYMMSLGPAESNAWHEAFWGQEDYELAVGEPIPDDADAPKHGCQMYGAGKALSKEERIAGINVGEASQVLWERTTSDPRVVAAERELNRCLEERGGIASGEYQSLFETIEKLPTDEALERIDELRQIEIAANEVESMCAAEHYDDVYTEVESEIYPSVKEEYNDQLASAARVASSWSD